MTDSEKIIGAFGGVADLCKVCDLPYQTVYAWKRRGIPTGWLKYLRKRNPNVFRQLETRP